MNKAEARNEAFNVSWPLNKLKSGSDLITHPLSHTVQIPSSSSLQYVMTYVRLYTVIFFHKGLGKCHHLFSIIIAIYTQQICIWSMSDVKFNSPENLTFMRFAQFRWQEVNSPIVTDKGGLYFLCWRPELPLCVLLVTQNAFCPLFYLWTPMHTISMFMSLVKLAFCTPAVSSLTVPKYVEHFT